MDQVEPSVRKDIAAEVIADLLTPISKKVHILLGRPSTGKTGTERIIIENDTINGRFGHIAGHSSDPSDRSISDKVVQWINAGIRWNSGSQTETQALIMLHDFQDSKTVWDIVSKAPSNVRFIVDTNMFTLNPFALNAGLDIKIHLFE